MNIGAFGSYSGLCSNGMAFGVAGFERTGRRLALVSVAVGTLLAIVKIIVGLLAHSTALVSDGFESGADVVSSGIVFFGLVLASRPPDQNHPYGHGRYETLAGLAVGGLLLLTGVGIFWRSFETLDRSQPPQAFALYPLAVAALVKTVLAATKKRIGRRLGSSALEADAWHDITDLLSTAVALCAIGLALHDPIRLGAADHVGGMVIGLIVVFVAIRLVWNTVAFLTDTMPGHELMEQIRPVALTIPGAKDIEKCYARRTGLKYHVDLHLEVDPELTVRQSHSIAEQVRIAVRGRLSWVADVLVHVEPWPGPRVAAAAAPVSSQRDYIHPQ
jgi:cation diffusion facilitator family transporter